MKFRLAAALLPVILMGCGPSPDNQSANGGADKPVNTQGEIGFFSELPQFIEVDDITNILAVKQRLNLRHEMMIEHHQDRIQGANILDFGSYDGRWAYAAIQAGAKHVTGIEINPLYADKAESNMDSLTVDPASYDFIVGDILAVLKEIEPGSYDGVICAGIYYHITYHVELMAEMQRLGIKWIIMDTAVMADEDPIIQWVAGPNGLNGLEGIPSRSAIEVIADAAGYKHEYVSVEHLTHPEMWDYRLGNRVTMTLY
jgi:hypothetical protein